LRSPTISTLTYDHSHLHSSTIQYPETLKSQTYLTIRKFKTEAIYIKTLKRHSKSGLFNGG